MSVRIPTCSLTSVWIWLIIAVFRFSSSAHNCWNAWLTSFLALFSLVNQLNHWLIMGLNYLTELKMGLIWFECLKNDLMDNFKILILHENFEKPLLNRTSDMFYYRMKTVPLSKSAKFSTKNLPTENFKIFFLRIPKIVLFDLWLFHPWTDILASLDLSTTKGA